MSGGSLPRAKTPPPPAAAGGPQPWMDSMLRIRSGLVLACLLGATAGLMGEEKPAPANPAPSKDATKERAGAKTGDSRPRPTAKRTDQVEKASETLLDLERKLRTLEVAAAERRRTAEDRLADLAREKEILERSSAVLTRHVATLEKELETKKAKATKDEAEATKLTNQAGQILES